MLWCLSHIYLNVRDINYFIEVKTENMVLTLLPHLKDLCIVGNVSLLSPFLELPLIFNELTASK